jgi:hypothetical protein
MKPNVNAIERAFELARSGRCVTLKEIRACLRAEGYAYDLVVGRYLSAQPIRGGGTISADRNRE